MNDSSSQFVVNKSLNSFAVSANVTINERMAISETNINNIKERIKSIEVNLERDREREIESMRFITTRNLSLLALIASILIPLIIK